MKIRKFNESNSDKLDEEYLSFIFSDFIDNGSRLRVDEKYWQIFLEEPIISNIFENIDNYTKSIDEIFNFSKELESCFKRIDDDFPDAKYNLIIDEIVNDHGNNIFSSGDIRRLPSKIRRILIIEFDL